MNYDEYIQEVHKYLSDEAVARLISHLSAWKSDDTDVVELAKSIEKLYGSSWVTDENTHNYLYQYWSRIKAAAISGIGGMILNERLYLFGLFERLESASESENKYLYNKLCANT